MESTYQSIACEHGPGMKARMFAIMDRKMAERSIYPTIRDLTCGELRQTLDTSAEIILAEANSWFTDLGQRVAAEKGPESEASQCNPRERQRLDRVLQRATEIKVSIGEKAQRARDEARRQGLLDV